MILVYELPTSFIYERYFTGRNKQTPFVQGAAPFEDFVVRCVRYAFAKIPPKVGRVFFSRQVALPFLRFRMLRHGFIRSPIHWHEYKNDKCRGVWIINNPTEPVDVCVYYAHGGGFSMGSPYFLSRIPAHLGGVTRAERISESCHLCAGIHSGT
ncbi:charged multivesicular body protein [Apiospora arundinis]